MDFLYFSLLSSAQILNKCALRITQFRPCSVFDLLKCPVSNNLWDTGKYFECSVFDLLKCPVSNNLWDIGKYFDCQAQIPCKIYSSVVINPN
jgi:hypothetical protein